MKIIYSKYGTSKSFFFFWGKTTTQSSKFRKRNWVEINDDSRGTYSMNSQIKFETTILKSSIRDHSEP